MHLIRNKTPVINVRNPVETIKKSNQRTIPEYEWTIAIVMSTYIKKFYRYFLLSIKLIFYLIRISKMRVK